MKYFKYILHVHDMSTIHNTLYVIHYISTFRIPSLTFINSRVHPPFSESNRPTRSSDM